MHLPVIVSRILDAVIIVWAFIMLLRLIRGTRAVQLLKGLAVILAVFYLTRLLDLVATNWLLQKLSYMLMVAVPIVFYPELRRTLEQLGRGWSLSGNTSLISDEAVKNVIGAIIEAAGYLSSRRQGAIIVIERDSGLGEYAETGTLLMCRISSEIIETIFQPQTPLHDGAIILRGETLLAAGCFLPLSDRNDLPQYMGTRHRAAAGIAEETDALAIIISEETGRISMAADGKISTGLTLENLETGLRDFYRDYRRSFYLLLADDISLKFRARKERTTNR
ncbi:MAG: diadenylate cyclase CdaA [bacterium]|jgi:diadenylate cyclase|nr:diadenylate cyclase CdaA [bacterium]MDD3805156.1 diadenylate cyclase CdaA [bacterium]MDD4152988.1 diadenylate cyclase CdaA [bacterium]